MRNRTIPFFPKNPTPLEIAQYSAIIITSALFVGLILTKYAFVQEIPLSIVLILSLTIYLVSLYLILMVLEQFIYRRVKLIYKTIHRLKAPEKKTLDRLSIKDQIIDQVEREVLDWTANQQREIEDLKKMAAYRRDFVGNVSHELKTPIFSMQGYIDTLLEGGLYDKTINESFLKRADHNLQRLKHIVEDLDVITKLETDVLQVELERFDMAVLVREVFAELESFSVEKNIALKQKSDLPFFVLADRDRIQQVLVNLIVNSIKYGDHNGKTQVSFYIMDEKTALVEVSDDGIGIEEKDLPRLFERFFRVDKSRSRDKGGTGLGLAIVKHMVEAHHQTINVRSTVGVGSTFGFTLEKVN